jgi:Fic family protein
MSNPLSKIDELAAELQSLQPLSPENQERLDKKFRLEFNYNSNHLEGNTLTHGETQLLLFFGETKGNHNLREYDEMNAHDAAFRMIREGAKTAEYPLTEQYIKNLNKIILVRPFWKEAITPDGQNTRRPIEIGDYKKQPNSVRLANGEMFYYASPIDTPIKMKELLEWYRKEEKNLHPLVLAAMLHYKFVRIHPFDDGNGRVSRLLMNYVLLRNNLPPVVIKSADKVNYLNVLHQADSGDYTPFIEYIAEQLIWSLEISIKAAKGEDIEEATDVQKEIALLSKRLNAKDKEKKYPAMVYETFIYFSKNVWATIKKSLEQFDGLFTKNRENYFLNNFPGTYEKEYTTETSTSATSTEPKKIKVFGRFIGDDRIRQIRWSFTFYKLKGIEINIDIIVSASLDFEPSKYFFTLQIDNTTISKTKYSYGDFMPPVDIEKQQTILSKKLLEEIKQKVQINNANQELK